MKLEPCYRASCMQIIEALQDKCNELKAERDEYRTKYNDTYSALDDCAREHSKRMAELGDLPESQAEMLAQIKADEALMRECLAFIEDGPRGKQIRLLHGALITRLEQTK